MKKRKQRNSQSKFRYTIIPLFLLFSVFILTVLGILYFGNNSKNNINNNDINNNEISGNPTQGAQNLINNPTENPTERNNGVDNEVGNTDSSEQDSLAQDAIHRKANEILEQMSLEEKIGQMFLVRCNQANAI